jgi:hypothetical protein
LQEWVLREQHSPEDVFGDGLEPAMGEARLKLAGRARRIDPATTLLLRWQATNIGLASTSVTMSRVSMRLRKRAQVAPAKPPPMTTTRPAIPCAMPAAAASRKRPRLPHWRANRAG